MHGRNKEKVPEALSPQTTQSSRTPPDASFIPERLRREVEVSFIPERLSAPPRSKLSAMLNWTKMTLRKLL